MFILSFVLYENGIGRSLKIDQGAHHQVNLARSARHCKRRANVPSHGLSQSWRHRRPPDRAQRHGEVVGLALPWQGHRREEIDAHDVEKHIFAAVKRHLNPIQRPRRLHTRC